MSKSAAHHAQELDAIIDLVETSLAEDRDGARAEALLARLSDPDASVFARLSRVLRLTRPERCLLLCLIAHHVQPDLEMAIRAKSPLPYVHEALIRKLFGLDRMPIYTSDSALNLWQLVRAHDMGPGVPMGFEIDLAVIEWLVGKPGLEPALQQQLTRAEAADADHGNADDIARTIRAESGRAQGVICELTGAAGTDFSGIAADVASALNTALWVVQRREEALDPDQILRIHRFVAVQNAALFWQIAEPRHLFPRTSPSARLQFIANLESQPVRTPQTHRYLSFEIPAPPRAGLLEQLRTRFPDAPEGEIRRVAALRGLDSRMIETADTCDIDALARQALSRSTRALRAWAMPLSSNVGFGDLVVDAPRREQLMELVAQIRTRHKIMDKPEIARVYSQERALTILLQGPPGTGKTLCARVLAGETGLPLFRVDVASLVSKWRGETNKNLREMFAAATRSGAILFVDEFDAVASKRTDTRNEIARADNQNTAYFLQLIENAYEGTVVFASNRPKEIDEAMLRRIRHTLDFQPPGEAERSKLWRLALAPFESGPEVFEFSEILAPAFDFSGARIKAVVLNAYARGAACGDEGLTVEALRRATLAEARQNGRPPGKREMARVLSYGKSEIRAVPS